MNEVAEKAEKETLGLKDSAGHLLDECRMVLPGIQALFGFQLIAVFNQRFADLPTRHQTLHLFATALVALAIALVMAPAALHRQAEPRAVSALFLKVSSRLLLASMMPLAISICLEIYIICELISTLQNYALAIAFTLFLFFVLFWIMLPIRFAQKS